MNLILGLIAGYFFSFDKLYQKIKLSDSFKKIFFLIPFVAFVALLNNYEHLYVIDFDLLKEIFVIDVQFFRYKYLIFYLLISILTVQFFYKNDEYNLINISTFILLLNVKTSILYLFLIWILNYFTSKEENTLFTNYKRLILPLFIFISFIVYFKDTYLLDELSEKIVSYLFYIILSLLILFTDLIYKKEQKKINFTSLTSILFAFIFINLLSSDNQNILYQKYIFISVLFLKIAIYLLKGSCVKTLSLLKDINLAVAIMATKFQELFFINFITLSLMQEVLELYGHKQILKDEIIGVLNENVKTVCVLLLNITIYICLMLNILLSFNTYVAMSFVILLWFFMVDVLKINICLFKNKEIITLGFFNGFILLNNIFILGYLWP